MQSRSVCSASCLVLAVVVLLAHCAAATDLCSLVNGVFVRTTVPDNQIDLRIARGDFEPRTVRSCVFYDGNCTRTGFDGAPCIVSLNGTCVRGIYRCINDGLMCTISAVSDKTIHCDTPNVLQKDCTTDLPGICAKGITQCVDGQVKCVPTSRGTAEIPFNGLDDDCDCRIDQSNDNGSGNNAAVPSMGADETELTRRGPVVYADGIGAMIDRGVNPRFASNMLSAMTVTPDSNSRRLSSLIWQWGQFIDHDIALIRDNTSEPVPIPVPAGDPIFDPRGFGNVTIPFARSEYFGGITTPRQPISNLTHWLDGSMVYGSDPYRVAWLRTNIGGRMKMSTDGFLPLNTDLSEDNAESPHMNGRSPTFFVGGDIRVNEHVGLASMHTLWVREHNYWADRVSYMYPSWTDEMVYRLTRAIIVAEIQHIEYDEWLPALLGPFNLPPYAGYNPNLDARIANEFSSAAYRIGHTLLNDRLQRLYENGTVFERGHLQLRDVFFTVAEVTAPGSFDCIWRGFAAQQANEIDTMIIDSVRNFLFGRPGQDGIGGLDLIAINLQRGRDHGIPDYNAVRVAYNLTRLTSFNQITSNATLAAALQTVYTSIDNIDAFIGMLAEDHLFGASVGETHAAVFRDQFGRLRDANREFYLNNLVLTRDHPDILAEIERTKFAHVIQRNTGIQRLQPDVFFVPVESRDQLRCCDRLKDLNAKSFVAPSLPGFGL